MVARVEPTERCQSVEDGCCEGLIFRQRITIIAPEICPPLYGQVVKIEEKVTSMMMNKGRCRVTCELNKDSFYPRESVVISSTFDNTDCKKQIEKYTAVLLRRVQVFNVSADKLFFQRDQVLLQDAQTPGKDMKEKGIEQKQFTLDIPESVFVSEEEK